MAEVFDLLGQELFISFLTILAGVIGTALTWLSKNASDYIKEEVGNKQLQRILNQANEVVFTSVKAAMQEEVEDLKKKGDSEGLDPKDASRIKTDVVNRIVSRLSDEVLQKLDDNFGDVRGYLEDKVESVVNDVKQK